MAYSVEKAWLVTELDSNFRPSGQHDHGKGVPRSNPRSHRGTFQTLFLLNRLISITWFHIETVFSLT